ncbi:hypothetical protein [Fibrella forsythiae]|uniref:Lipoprotein n=1 Tax=Fibrella forsythiae TaxID=2817061 RepID=A0ABS3JSU4_9BACT|nr:hypothetical protein [Fibrella forsythiae]MBO0951962.1 hypothetical protein [Fibrella forsythiae]
MAKRMMVKWMTLLMLVIVLTSCQRAKDKGREMLEASIAKAKKKGSAALQSGAEAVAGKLTTTQTFSFQACFGKRDSLHIQEIDGLLIDIPPGFYQRFLTYKADQDTLLKFIETLPTQRLSISDKSYVKTDSSEMNKHLVYIEAKFPAVRNKLDFFYKVRQGNRLAYYRCNRFPFSHLLAFDKATETVYHFSEEYRD